MKILRLTCFALLSLGLMLSSCKKGERTPIDIQHDAVMAIHDEVMPKMRDIYKLKKQLKKSTGSELEVVKNSIAQLEKADDMMMNWMADYKKPKASDPEAMSYLASELQKVDIVRSTMLTSISNAENILSSNE